MIKHILICSLLICSLSNAMEEDATKKAARQQQLDELAELNPNPIKPTCGSCLFDGLYKLGNIIAGAQQFSTSTHLYDVSRVEWLAENSNDKINGVPFVYSYIAISDTQMLIKAIRHLSRKRPCFYFIHSNVPLNGADVFAAGTPPQTPAIDLKTIADKLKEHKEDLKLSMYADEQGNYLTGHLPADINKNNQLKSKLAQWLSITPQ